MGSRPSPPLYSSEKDSRRLVWWLFLWAALLFFPGLGSRDIWAPVEPRYAEIARVMLAKGEWIVPTVNGDLYTDKPILYFWLVLLGSKLAGGVSEWTLRLPSALSALGLILTTYLLGKDLFNPRVGFMAALILGSSARVLWEGRWAHTDMLFTFFFVLSLYFFSRALFHKGSQREFLLAYGLMALATLTKGLIGVVLPGLILLVFVAVRRRWRAVLEWRIPSGILVFLALAGPWFVSVSLETEGRWLREFILTHHVQRYTSGYGHREPFYYYLVNFPADFLPWTIFAVAALFAYRSRLGALKEPVPLFFFLWFVVIFLFFSLSDTKRGLYLLPLFPPAALFVASYFKDLTADNLPQDPFYRWLASLFFALLCIGSLSLPVAAWFFERGALGLSIPVALIMAGGGGMALDSILRRSPAAVFWITVLTLSLGMVYASLWIFPYLDRYKSPKPFALQVKKIVAPEAPLSIYADTMNDFNFYTEREVIPIVPSAAEAKKISAEGRRGYMLVRERDFERLGLDAAGAVATGQVGGKRWYLVALGRRG